MPNRIVRESILTSERVSSLAWPEEVFYRRLMSIVDDYGRTEAGAQLLRAKCYPLQTDQVRAADITRWMAACQKAGVILCYGNGGKQYLELVNFGQQLRSASKCPPPAIDSSCEETIGNAHLGVSVSEGVSVSVKGAGPFVVPEWIPSETWTAYLKTRAGKKAKNEPHALGLIVKDLEAFKAKGHDPVVVLNNSIKGGWAGVFEPKLPAADIRTITVPSKEPDATHVKLMAHKGDPMPDETRKKIAEIRKAA